jgi:[acyl-carrier-protein] S-malonyltransferase
MSAILGLDPSAVELACAEAAGPDGVAVAANLNSPDQVVISGDPAAVGRAGEGCKARGAKRVIALKVSGAFHSPLMAPAVSGLEAALAAAPFAAPAFPIVANATATPVQDTTEALRTLAAQLTAPVRWIECMQAASALAPEATFIEMGPGSVLSGLLRKILPGTSSVTLGTSAEVEAFLA